MTTSSVIFQSVATVRGHANDDFPVKERGVVVREFREDEVALAMHLNGK
jgi:hypothetical protein